MGEQCMLYSWPWFFSNVKCSMPPLKRHWLLAVQVIAVIVFLNLLIASMNTTVQKIQDRQDTYWKYARTGTFIIFVYSCNVYEALSIHETAFGLSEVDNRRHKTTINIIKKSLIRENYSCFYIEFIQQRFCNILFFIESHIRTQLKIEDQQD